ncbi:DUF4139 domain-containing protein [Streptomyces sp. NPDC057412]|uniref:DUF4139 domain-containing protein n=1 Tax=Streptomyces sp. NPDC057412 TaxID=3346123 RepID=UPI00368A8995
MKSEVAQTQGWASTLDAVVVYAQGALCTRVARGTVPADGRVRVTGLPRSLDPGSLRAKAVGGDGVRVTEVRVEVEAEPATTEDSGSLRREMERLRDAHAAAQARRDRQANLIGETAALRPVPPGREPGDPPRVTPADAWLRLAAFVDERLRAQQLRLTELEEEVRRAEHDLAVATDRWARASTDTPSDDIATSVVAVVTLDGVDAGAGPVDVELEYGVPGAVWVPAYRLTHRRGEDGGTLVLRASVAQRTGEDWTGVRLALATADLRRRTDLPRLRSLRLGRRQPAPAPSGWREPPAGLADLFSGYDAAGPRPVPVRAAPDPVPPPPPMPPGVGAAPVAPPAPGGPAAPGAAPFQAAPPPPPPAAPQAYGMPQAAFGGAPAAFDAAPRGAAPAMRSRRAAPTPPPPPAVTAPPQPREAELDYAALVLAGADEPGDRRGRLFPGPSYDPRAEESRRRAEAVASLPLPGHAVRPRTSAGSFDHRYDAVARADIPSDGVWHTVTVAEIPVGLRTEYVCVPSVEQTVYATVVLSNATDQALLAGPVEVMSGDDFLTTAALPTLAPGGVRRMGLGPAEGVRVTRRTQLHESTAGLRNNTTVLAHRVHVELANRLGHPVTVEVHEQVPVTSEPDVRIDEQAAWTAPRQDGPDRYAPGTRVWRVDLPAGGGTALDGGYDIRVPAAKALAGGNRRS